MKVSIALRRRHVVYADTLVRVDAASTALALDLVAALIREPVTYDALRLGLVVLTDPGERLDAARADRRWGITADGAILVWPSELTADEDVDRGISELELTDDDPARVRLAGVR